MNTDMCLLSKIKMDQIKKAEKEYMQEKIHLVKANYIIKCYEECNKMLQMSEETQGKVNQIIKTKELQKIKLKRKNEEVVSLFGLSDSKISSFYGDAALEVNEKQYLMEEINCQLLITFKKDSSSDELVRCFEKKGKFSSFLNSKLKIVRLMDTLQSKIIICQKLLDTTQGCLDHLGILRSSNKNIKDKHIKYIMDEADILSLTAKIVQSKIEEAILSENEDIVRAMDMLHDYLEKHLVEVTIKLCQLQTLSEEYKEVEGEKFKSLLKVYLQLLKSIKNSNFVLNIIKS